MKKNNLFKISLLLLVLNFTIIRSDELEACRDGVKNRNWQNGVPLIIDSSQISGNRTPVDTIREKAAWIFGYNSNIGYDNNGANFNQSDGALYTYGNGCVSWNGLSGAAYCIGGIDVCDYGSSIGWALNDDGSNTLNFYRNDGFNWPNYLLFFMWGKIFGSHQWGNGQRNMLQVINNKYISGGFSNSGVLGSGYSNGYPNTYYNRQDLYNWATSYTANNNLIPVNNTEVDGIKCVNPNNNTYNGFWYNSQFVDYGCDH